LNKLVPVAILFSILLVPLCAAANIPYLVHGQVMHNGVGVPDVEIIVANVNTNEVMKIKTGENGEYKADMSKMKTQWTIGDEIALTATYGEHRKTLSFYLPDTITNTYVQNILFGQSTIDEEEDTYESTSNVTETLNNMGDTVGDAADTVEDTTFFGIGGNTFVLIGILVFCAAVVIIWLKKRNGNKRKYNDDYIDY